MGIAKKIVRGGVVGKHKGSSQKEESALFQDAGAFMHQSAIYQEGGLPKARVGFSTQGHRFNLRVEEMGNVTFSGRYAPPCAFPTWESAITLSSSGGWSLKKPPP